MSSRISTPNRAADGSSGPSVGLSEEQAGVYLRFMAETTSWKCRVLRGDVPGPEARRLAVRLEALMPLMPQEETIKTSADVCTCTRRSKTIPSDMTLQESLDLEKRFGHGDRQARLPRLLSALCEFARPAQRLAFLQRVLGVLERARCFALREALTTRNNRENASLQRFQRRRPDALSMCVTNQEASTALDFRSIEKASPRRAGGGSPLWPALREAQSALNALRLPRDLAREVLVLAAVAPYQEQQ